MLSKYVAWPCYWGKEKYDWAELLYQGVTAGPDKKPKVFTSFHLSLLSLILATFTIPWQLFLDFSSCFLSFQPRSSLCACVCSPFCPTPSRLRLTCLHLSPVCPSLLLFFLTFFFYAILLSLTHRPCDGNLRPCRPLGEHSPAVHIQAAAFPISPRVSVFPPSTLSVCPSATLRPSPAALPLHASLLLVPLRAFQDSHKSFLPSKLVVSSGWFA